MNFIDKLIDFNKWGIVAIPLALFVVIVLIIDYFKNPDKYLLEYEASKRYAIERDKFFNKNIWVKILFSYPVKFIVSFGLIISGLVIFGEEGFVYYIYGLFICIFIIWVIVLIRVHGKRIEEIKKDIQNRK